MANCLLIFYFLIALYVFYGKCMNRNHAKYDENLIRYFVEFIGLVKSSFNNEYRNVVFIEITIFPFRIVMLVLMQR